MTSVLQAGIKGGTSNYTSQYLPLITVSDMSFLNCYVTVPAVINRPKSSSSCYLDNQWIENLRDDNIWSTGVTCGKQNCL